MTARCKKWAESPGEYLAEETSVVDVGPCLTFLIGSAGNSCAGQL